MDSKGWYELNIMPVDEGILVFSIDRTRRNEAEEKLRISENKLKEAQSIAHIGNWEFDLIHHQYAWSDEFCKIYGLGKEEQLQPNLESFLSFVHPDDLSYVLEIFRNSIDQSEDAGCNFRFIRKDGVLRYGYTEWRFEFNSKNEPVRLFGILQDVSQRKLTELELESQNKELAFQSREKEKRADELILANAELVFQNGEKEKRADELIIANTELRFQNGEKEKRADELRIANIEMAFQKVEKEKRADELILTNAELVFQNGEKEKRADELFLANAELIFQNEEKEKRADELRIANIEMAFQKVEKEKRAEELIGINIELVKTENDLKEYIKGLEEMMFVTSHKVRQPVANILGILNHLEDSANSPHELSVNIGYIKKSAMALENFTIELIELIELMSNLEQIVKKQS